MREEWKACKKILCVRADNMGDVIMCGPAMAAIKQATGADITLLTSSAGAQIAPFLYGIDDCIIMDSPWVHITHPASRHQMDTVITEIRQRQFDAAIVFTVYSQSALPAALFLWWCDIPLRLAYARENPYGLLTHWMVDEEPYHAMQHQVERDMHLLSGIGIAEAPGRLRLKDPSATDSPAKSLVTAHANKNGWIILHPGVSELKRQYPVPLWKEILDLLSRQTELSIYITGGKSEVSLAKQIGHNNQQAVVLAGNLSLNDFLWVIQQAKAVITVNTSTTHIAAAYQVPQVVLYAKTNPQHTPWKAPHKVFYFPVAADLKSKNQVLRFADEHWQIGVSAFPQPTEIVAAALGFCDGRDQL